jgi:hypothetical protein
MIGYMKPVKKLFTKEERDVYQSIYCGLCRCLKYEYGYTGMATLNYEIVNMLMVVGAMQPEPYREAVMCCSISPLLWRPMAVMDQDAFCAAAAVSIAAADLEIQDNIHDSNKWYDRLLHTLIDPKAKKAMKCYRAELEQLRQQYARFMELESRAAADDPDITFQMLMDASGDIIAEAADIVGIHAGCSQLGELHSMMHLWGQWIYLIDAVDDYDSDRADGSFNPLFLSDKPTSTALVLETIELHAKTVMDEMFLRNYETVVSALFQKHIPYRRNLIFNKVKTIQTEGEQDDTPIYTES